MTIAPKPPAKCLAVLGTGSDVGKSVVVAALCRIFSNRGVQVAPFKAQNMSNNSFVTVLGGEVGRAQVVQAEAARVPIHVDMNPVLLKPCTDTGAQVILHGKAIGNSEASTYFANTDFLFRQALSSLERLRADHDLIVMEGAGSCAEVNLRDRDFVNFRMAHAADAPVILVADIDRGGVFAQVVGTLDVIPREDRDRIRGILINRFRGDARLFADGIEYLEKRTGLPLLGLIPYYRHIEIDSEDGMPLDVAIDPPAHPSPEKINIAVLRFPHISNFTDFAPLAREPIVSLHYLSRPRSLEGYDVVFLPGSKNVRSDLEWMRTVGWAAHIEDYAAGKGKICGICGGYQMLGRLIRDPHGMEGAPGDTAGLGLLNVQTTLAAEKVLSRSTGIWKANGKAIEGYEIHMGVTESMENTPAVIHVASRNGQAVHDVDGAASADGTKWGVYFHGLFDLSDFRISFLEALKPELHARLQCRSQENEPAFKERQYNLLAEHFSAHMDMPKLLEIAGL
jgi:adenosylcobyric acid synthase